MQKTKTMEESWKKLGVKKIELKIREKAKYFKNEGALKMAEGTRVEKALFQACTDKLYDNCGDKNECLNLCRKKYGFLGSENEMVEGRRVEKKLYETCIQILYGECEDNDKCFTDCRENYGYLASGVCNYREECECRRPC
ncbi:hypothetical protein V8G54_026675 [Vigna mungo]|uniref:Uncharacterized protein n=1 Tax=Vigna mungo TaxID=3915 RepID=A0AAQ3N1G6_VIGMU